MRSNHTVLFHEAPAHISMCVYCLVDRNSFLTELTLTYTLLLLDWFRDEVIDQT